MGSQARGALAELETLYHEGGLPQAVRSELRSTLDAIVSHRSAGTHTFISLSTLGPPIPLAEPRKSDEIPNLELEDQAGHHLHFAEFFHQKPSIVVFFYTRCSNPNKCSLTVTKLGQLQGMIVEEGLMGRLRTAAFTYDPQFDLPPRLRAYGLNRGVSFGEDNRFFRSLHGLTELQEYFGLGVNFNGSIVNQHRIELFLLDPRGGIVKTFSRLQWDVKEVLDSARALLPAPS
jgi:protein SCO1/2